MSPKSLLRHPKCVSRKEDFATDKGFEKVIDDHLVQDPGKVKRVVFCSGKIYYDLLEHKEKTEDSGVALVRLEQLYPLPSARLEEIENKYPNAERCWVQEEPANMGGWVYIQHQLLDWDLKPVFRDASASPSTGFKKIHDEQQEQLVREAFAQ